MPLTYAGRVGPEDALVEAVVDGLTAAGTGGAGVILGINRGLGTETARHSLDLALRWAGRGVVALGLAGGEAGYPAAPFAPMLRRAAETAGCRACHTPGRYQVNRPTRPRGPGLLCLALPPLRHRCSCGRSTAT